MADGEVVVKVTLDETGVTKGLGRARDELGRFKKQTETTGDESMWQGIKSGSAAAENLGKAMAGAGTAMSLGITVPLVAVGKSGLEMAADFQTTMAQVQVATGEGADGMQALESYAKQMGAETIYSASECGDAMLELAKGGLTSADIQGGALTNTLTLATAGGLELGDAANTIVQSMGAFGLTADESARATNSLAGAANASSADVSDLAQGLAQCSAVANNAGWSIEETSAVMGELADAGIKGSDAGTSLKTMLISIEAPSKTAADAIAQYGLNVRDSNGNIKDAASLSQEFQDKLGGLDSAQQQAALSAIFGSDAMRAGTVLMNNGASGLQKYTDATNSAQSAQDMAAASMSGTNGALEQLSGSLDNVKMVVGDALAPTIQAAAGFLQGLADGFSALPAPIQQGIVAVLAIVAVIGPLLAAIGVIMLAMPAILTTLGMIFSPVTLIVGAIAGVVAALVYLWNTNEGFRNSVQACLDQIMTTLQPAIDFVVSALTVMASMVQPILQGMATIIGSVFLGALQVVTGAITGIAQIVSGTFGVIQGTIEMVLGLILGIFTGDWSLMNQGANDAFNGLLSIGTGLMNALSGAIQGIMTAITGIFTGAWDAVTGAASNAFSTLANIVRDRLGDAQSTVANSLDNIANFFSNLHIEFPHINLPHFGISGSFNLDPANFSVPSLTVDWYAKGGIFDSASVVGVGEAGREAALPLNSRSYGEIADGIEGQMDGGGRTVTVTVRIDRFVNETEEDIDDLVDRVTRDIQKKLDRQNRSRGLVTT
jgi:TP901 family phage tail tape measure protein